ncbi:hypothetical protein KL934_005117 [Ogataea polymorpha]|nr:hypothetical protein KL927_005106 [Ogataea polymorpha]KAG7930187.1 hypothetical protein KL934_005117 [Ogataea polymorpha]
MKKSLFFKNNYRMLSTIVGNSAGKFLKSNPSAITIDSTWYFPNDPRDAFAEFTKHRLTNKTVFFDIDDISDHSSPFPHMLPSKSQFESQVSKLGIRNDSPLLIYDRSDVYSSCRASWMFEIFGHNLEKIYLLDTFAQSDVSTDQPIDSASQLPESEYKATFDKSKVVLFEELKELVLSDKIGKDYNVVDARSGPRFKGEAPEIRPGLSSGHIKNAINIPFTDFLTSDKKFKSASEILERATAAGLDQSKPIIDGRLRWFLDRMGH